MDKTYRVKMAREGTEFEVEGDKEFVLEMLERFESKTLGVTKEQSETREVEKRPAKEGGKALSAGEFIQRFGFKRHTDKTLAFGYYLEHYAGKSEYTPADINNCYYEAKLETSNTSQAIIQNIKGGRMMEAKAKKGQRKRFTITLTGQTFIEKKLSQTSE